MNIRGLYLLPVFLFVASTTAVAAMRPPNFFEGRGRSSGSSRETERQQVCDRIEELQPTILPLLAHEGITLSDEQRKFIQSMSTGLQLLLDALKSTDGLAGPTGSDALTRFDEISSAHFHEHFPLNQPDALQAIRASLNHIGDQLEVINVHMRSITAAYDEGSGHDDAVPTAGSSAGPEHAVVERSVQAGRSSAVRARVDDGPASIGRLGVNLALTGTGVVFFIDGVRHVMMLHNVPIFLTSLGVSVLMAMGTRYFGRNVVTQGHRLMRRSVGSSRAFRWLDGKKQEDKKKE